MNRKSNKKARKHRKKTPVRDRQAALSFKEVVDYYQAGKIQEAFTFCHRITVTHPHSPQAWHLLGLLAFKLGKINSAIKYLHKAVTLNPDHAAALNDLGNALTEISHMEEAENAYRRAIRTDPGFGSAHSNLGRLLRQQAKLSEAVEHGKKAVQLAPDANSYYNLALSQKDAGQISAAIDAFQKVLELDPCRPDVLRQLCSALRHEKRWDEAKNVCDRWLTLEPENPVARHIHAALDGQCFPERASDNYVRHVFDQFARNYDKEMQELDYQGPGLLMDALRKQFPMAAADLDTLDAGCGTGMCGHILRPFAKHLTGVDLSENMLKKARSSNCYDELTVGELNDFLDKHLDKYDLIVAIDTMNYFGDLTNLLKRMTQALRTQGVLIFTLEQSAQAQCDKFQLNQSGRYSHNKDYVRDLLITAGLWVESMETVTLRAEAGIPVEGFLTRVVNVVSKF
jgi:predicted TPR repeat methyltransferase